MTPRHKRLVADLQRRGLIDQEQRITPAGHEYCNAWRTVGAPNPNLEPAP